MSLVQIVDENDEVIGHKPRAEVDPQKDIYRSSCIWIENSKGEVLLAQRKWTKDKDPGMWGPAASGTIDEGETYESNAYKETEEEIGLTGFTLTPIAKIRETNPRQHFIQVFKAVTDWPIESFTVQQAEVEQIIWLTKADLATDFGKNPQKYIPGMPRLLLLFLDAAKVSDK